MSGPPRGFSSVGEGIVPRGVFRRTSATIVDRGRRFAAHRRDCVCPVDRPGHWATGQRAEEHSNATPAAVRCHRRRRRQTRLAYCELQQRRKPGDGHRDLRRAEAWDAQQAAGRSQAVKSRQPQGLNDHHRFTRAPDRLRRPPDPHPALHALWNAGPNVLGTRPPRVVTQPRMANSTQREPAHWHRSCVLQPTAPPLTAPAGGWHPSPAPSQSASRTPSARRRERAPGGRARWPDRARARAPRA
jgi:hypothetical protein